MGPDRRMALFVTVIMLAPLACAMAGASTGDDWSADAARGSRAIIKEPFLQNVTTSTITIVWETDTVGSSDVEYGATTAYGNTTNGAGGVTIHEVNLTGLEVDTVYHYRMGTDGTYSQDYTFKTAVPRFQPFNFSVYGDTRTNHADHQSVIGRMIKYHPEFTLNAGDLVESGGIQANWDAFFDDLDGLVDHTPYYPCIGNHDLPPDIYLDYFSLPNNEYWYSFDYGSAHFVVLDTNQNYATGSPQLNWLVSDVEAANDTAEWKFAMFHHPAYSSSGHGSTPDVQTYIQPILEQYQFDAVFSGHDHDYEHAIVNDIHYIVSGGGGAPLAVNGTSSWTVYSESTLHFMMVEIYDNVAEFIGVRPNGTTFDAFNITKPDLRPPMPIPLTATDTGLGGSVDLDWSTYDEDLQRDVAGYRVYWATADFSTVESMTAGLDLPAGTQTTRIEGLVNDTTYHFAVTAVDEVPNEDKAVVTASATPTDITPPAVPIGLAVDGPTYTTLNLSWGPNLDADLGGYRVFVNSSGTGPGGPYDQLEEVATDVTNRTVTGLVQNTTYCFVLQAIDMATVPNNSTFSAEACAATMAMPVNKAPVARETTPFLFFLEDTVPEDERAYQLDGDDGIFYDPDDDPIDIEVTASDMPYRLSNMSTAFDWIIFEPPENWNGEGYANLSASDGDLSCWSNLTVIVQGINDPPTITAPSEWTVREDETSALNFSVSDIETPHDELSAGTDLRQMIPGGEAVFDITMDGGLHRLDLTPDNDNVGECYFNLTVTDELGSTAYALVHLTIINTNDPPRITDMRPDDGSRYDAGEMIDFQAYTEDDDEAHGDTLSYQWSNNRTGVFSSERFVTCNFTEPGDYVITLTVTDGEGATATETRAIEVIDDSNPPVPPPPPPDPPIEDDVEAIGYWMVLAGVIIGIIVIVMVAVIMFIVTRIKATDAPPTVVQYHPPPTAGYQYQYQQQPQQPPPEAVYEPPPPPGETPADLPGPEGAAQSRPPEEEFELIQGQEDERP